jgi:anti-anti-sigma regulatory factor
MIKSDFLRRLMIAADSARLQGINVYEESLPLEILKQAVPKIPPYLGNEMIPFCMQYCDKKIFETAAQILFQKADALGEYEDVSIRQMDGIVDSVWMRIKADRIDAASTLFRKRIAMAIGYGFIRIVLDIGEISFIDNESADIFPLFRDSCRRKGGELVIVCSLPEIELKIRAVKTERNVPIFSNIQAAYSYMVSSLE